MKGRKIKGRIVVRQAEKQGRRIEGKKGVVKDLNERERE